MLYMWIGFDTEDNLPLRRWFISHRRHDELNQYVEADSDSPFTDEALVTLNFFEFARLVWPDVWFSCYRGQIVPSSDTYYIGERDAVLADQIDQLDRLNLALGHKV